MYLYFKQLRRLEAYDELRWSLAARTGMMDANDQKKRLEQLQREARGYASSAPPSRSNRVSRENLAAFINSLPRGV